MFRSLTRRLTVPVLTVPASALAAAAIVFANPTGEAAPADHVENMTALAQPDTRVHMHVTRIEYKIDLTRRLAAGELSLDEVTAEFLAMNRDVPYIHTAVHGHYPGATPEERTAVNVIEFVRNMHLPAAQEAAALARLHAEFETRFGHAPGTRG